MMLTSNLTLCTRTKKNIITTLNKADKQHWPTQYMKMNDIHFCYGYKLVPSAMHHVLAEKQ